MERFNDTNYHLSVVRDHYLPVGVVGLIVAVIFSAAMSSTSGEINSLAAVTVIDIYRRHIRKGRLRSSLLDRLALGDGLLGLFAVGFAQYGKNFGALIEAVNIVGSLFYGGMLGVFVLAFFFKQRGGERRVLRRAGGRSGDLRGLPLHQHRVPLVQRDRLPRGDRGVAWQCRESSTAMRISNAAGGITTVFSVAPQAIEIIVAHALLRAASTIVSTPGLNAHAARGN